MENVKKNFIATHSMIIHLLDRFGGINNRIIESLTHLIIIGFTT